MITLIQTKNGMHEISITDCSLTYWIDQSTLDQLARMVRIYRA